jgi:hypothetical protein
MPMPTGYNLMSKEYNYCYEKACHKPKQKFSTYCSLTELLENFDALKILDNRNIIQHPTFLNALSLKNRNIVHYV